MHGAIEEYLAKDSIKLQNKREEFADILRRLEPFKPVGPDTKILEIGIGSGWFQILCAKQGIPCRGVELYPALTDAAQRSAEANGVKLSLDTGDVADVPLGQNQYDIVIANSVFEHVRDWKAGATKVWRALKPGGILWFISTNKFAFTSGEYDKLPLYGWLPDRLRYAARKKLDRPDVMEVGIDFHQFTYPYLRRHFRRIGFSKTYDYIDILQRIELNHPKPWKRLALKAWRSVPLLKPVTLTFVDTTYFICQK